MNKKILIGTPTAKVKEYCLFDWIKHTDNLNGDFDILIVDNSDDALFIEKIKNFISTIDKKHNIMVAKIEKSFLESHFSFIARTQEAIRQIFLSSDYRKLLFLESDIFPVCNDTILRLDAWEVPVISALYFWNESFVMDGYFYEYDNGALNFSLNTCDYLLNNNINLTEPIKTGNGGFGCTLIDRKTLSEIPIRIVPHRRVHSDTIFAEDMIKKGKNWYIDTSLLCEHRHKSWEDMEKEFNVFNPN